MAVLRGLTDERIKKLQAEGKPWKYCWHHTHTSKPTYVEAVCICENCEKVYCADHMTCACDCDE